VVEQSVFCKSLLLNVLNQSAEARARIYGSQSMVAVSADSQATETVALDVEFVVGKTVSPFR
jgi:hypothetical protein